MPEEKVNIQVLPDAGELVIRHGEAQKLYDPEPLRIVGNIDAPSAFYLARKALPGNGFSLTNDHVLVRRDQGVVEFVINESSKFAGRVTGKLVTSNEYDRLGINLGTQHSPVELGKMLRRNLFLFASQDEGRRLVADLMAFTFEMKAKGEQSKDERGNRKNSLEVSLETSVPLDFVLAIPLYKGAEPQKIKVAIELESRGNQVECSLVSIEATVSLESTRDFIINQVIAPFKEDGVTVIEA